MSSNPAVAKTARPRVVDWALYALMARCAFSVLASVSLFFSRGALKDSLAKTNPSWSAAKLQDQVNSFPRTNLIASLVAVVVVLAIAKFIRDGRNLARWVLVLVSVLVTRDVINVLSFASSDGPVAYRMLTGLVGVAIIVAIFLLFLRPAGLWFTPAGQSPLRTMFAGRATAPAPVEESVDEPAVSLTKPKRPQPARRPNGSPRPAPKSPRAKSRRSAE